MPFVEKLKAIRDEKHITNVDLAKLADTPLATITRVFNGQTPNPTFETVSRIAIALGVSLDELTGFKSADAPPVPSRVEVALNSYSELLMEKDSRIEDLKKDKRVLWRVLIGIFGFILLLLAYDLLNGDLGYFRH